MLPLNCLGGIPLNFKESLNEKLILSINTNVQLIEWFIKTAFWLKLGLQVAWVAYLVSLSQGSILGSEWDK